MEINEEQCLKKLLEAKRMYALEFLVPNVGLNESSSERDKLMDKAFTGAKKMIHSIRSPKQLKKFIDSNGSKIEEAAEKLPPKKKSSFRKAWDFLCHAANETFWFFVKNFFIIALALLIVALVWIFRDAIGKMLFGGKEKERLRELEAAAKQEVDNAKQYTTAALETAKTDAYKEFVKDAKARGTLGKMLASIVLTLLEKAAAVIELQFAKRHAGKTAGQVVMDEFITNYYVDALASILNAGRKYIVSLGESGIVDSAVDSIKDKFGLDSAAYKLALKAKEKVDASKELDAKDWSFAWNGGVVNGGDVQAQRDGAEFCKQVGGMQKQIQDAFATAKDGKQGAARLIKILHNEQLLILKMHDEVHNIAYDSAKSHEWDIFD